LRFSKTDLVIEKTFDLCYVPYKAEGFILLLMMCFVDWGPTYPMFDKPIDAFDVEEG
jgi:hypothetical protein